MLLRDYRIGDESFTDIINGKIREQGGQEGGISICIDSYKSDPVQSLAAM